MNELVLFLEANLNESGSQQLSDKYKVGIRRLEFLESIYQNVDMCDARTLYVLNLCLNDPIRFIVPLDLPPEEQALMHLSFNEFDNALRCLNLPLECEIIGALGTKRTGGEINVDILQTKNTESKELLDFTSDGLVFNEFKAQPLNKKELLWVYIKMIEVYRTEENENLRKFKLMAYFRRVLFGAGNALDGFLKTAYYLLYAEMTNEIKELEKTLCNRIDLCESIFSEPIVWKSEICIQIGRSLMNTFDFGEAYKILEPFPLFYDKIKCLIALKMSEEAVAVINMYIKIIGEPKNRKDRMILGDLYIKLGHLYQNPAYFDLSAEVFKSHKPFLLKGLHHFRLKNFNEAVDALENAVKITPNNEEVLFSYACALFESERVGEALKIFRKLYKENPLNMNVAKNLSSCYYRLRDIENTLETLKSISLQDHSSMKQFLYISLRNDLLENVIWALERMNYDEIIKEVINYLIQYDKISKDKLLNHIGKNVYLKECNIETLFN